MGLGEETNEHQISRNRQEESKKAGADYKVLRLRLKHARGRFKKVVQEKEAILS